MRPKRTTKPSLVTCSFGGGVQTQFLKELVLHGELPKPDAFIFADTGDEPSYVYDQVEESRKQLTAIGVPLITVSNGNLHDDVYGGGRFAAMPLFTKLATAKRGKKQKITAGTPTLFDLEDYYEKEPEIMTGFGLESKVESRGIMKRQCTGDYKIVPIDKELRIMLLEMGLAKANKIGSIYVNKDAWVETWIGYSVDEATRMKPSRLKWQDMRYPLIEKRMSKANIIARLEAWKIKPYLSSNCRKCPVISDRRSSELMVHDPDGWENRCQFDDDLRNGVLRIAASARAELFVHPSLIPLRDVKLDPNREPLFGCHGSCFT